jgi:mevalonate kinase
VRRTWQADPQRFEALFDSAGSIAQTARRFIESGRPAELGPLMDENHAILREMGVSCPELETLVEAARRAGARGAKLSGGGRGGNMLALVETGQVEPVLHALISAGAKRAFSTQVRPPREG